jgi:NTE family protein
MGPVITEPHVDEQPVPSESYGPATPPEVVPAPEQTETATVTAVTTATATAVATAPDAPKLCLVLGPGMAKAMAEAAVLEAIRKAKIPVHCVVGTEMGAIVGALYAFSNGSTNNLQWQLFKINKENYFNFPMLSLREPRSSGRRLNEFLRGIFHDTNIEALPIRFATTAVDDESDTPVEFTSGNLAEALSASSALPGIFEYWKINGGSYRSAAVSDPAPIELAKKMGGNFIVMVDVLLDSGASAKTRFHRAFTAARSLMRLQKKEASFVIQVNSSAIAFDDFGRQGEILSAGSAAAEKSLPDLKAAWEKWVAGTH